MLKQIAQNLYKKPKYT